MGISTTPTKIARLAEQAYAHYVAFQEALRKEPIPDKTLIDKEIEALGLSLQQLMAATNQNREIQKPGK